jgi:cell shape-determining protein MreD
MIARWLKTALILLVAFGATFWEAAFNGIRHWLGAQIDLLPALMVYASLHTGIMTVSLLAVLGGLWFDTLSANPLGVTVVPLFGVGMLIYLTRDLILREQTFAQVTLGLAGSLFAPVCVLLLLLTTGHDPLFGWGTLWQLLVMGLGGAIATPVIFEVFAWLERILGYAGPSEPSFRPDREIRRGR